MMMACANLRAGAVPLSRPATSPAARRTPLRCLPAPRLTHPMPPSSLLPLLRPHSTPTRGAPARAFGGGGDKDPEQLKAWEEELKNESPVGYLLPRPVRTALLGGVLAACVIATLTGTARLADGTDESPVNLLINLAGGAACVWALGADRRAGERRAVRRAEVREAQIKSGDREVMVSPTTGQTTTRLKKVDDEWVLKRLERWGRKDQLPFVGLEKGEKLQKVVREANPKLAFEVGTLLGYSAIRIAQAMPEGSKLVTCETEWTWGLWAKRFLWQASEGRAEGNPVGNKVDVRIGDAREEVKKVGAGGEKIDFLFIDGTPREYLSYLLAAEPYLAPGATVVADNAGVFAEGGLKDYLEHVRTSGKYRSSEYVESTLEWRPDVPDGLEVSVFAG